jgi:hypothetical protein
MLRYLLGSQDGRWVGLIDGWCLMNAGIIEGHKHSATGRVILLMLVFSAARVPGAEPQSNTTGQACKKPQDASTISFTEAGSSPQVLQVRGSRGAYSALAHLRIRNDSAIALNQWCFSTDLVDYSGKGEPTTPTLSNPHSTAGRLCIEQSVASGSVATFDLSLPIVGHSLPWSGVLIASAKGLSVEKLTTAQTAGVTSSTSAELPKDKTRGAAGQASECEVSSKDITKEIVILSPSPSADQTAIVFLAAGVAGLGLIVGLFRFRGKLGTPMGLPTWNFTSSWATNVVVAGGILTPVINASVMPDYPHFMVKQGYSVLAMLFSAMIVIAPVLYIFWSKPAGTGGGQSVGNVGIFLLSAAFTICAVIGQILTVLYILGEFAIRGYVSVANLWPFYILLLATGIGMMIYTVRNVRFAIGSGDLGGGDESAATEHATVEDTARVVGPRQWRVL